MAITKWDEYLIHQTYDTIDGGDVEVDRLYMSCHDAEGILHLAAGLGAYPKAHVMDGYVCVRHKDVQHNVRLSRHLKNDRADTVIGPLCFKVLEPLKRWGLYLDDNDYGVGCSVEFEGRAEPFLSKHSGFVHYNQAGRYTGSITLGSQKFNVDGFIGGRDRTWRVPIQNMFLKGPWYGHFWFIANFADFSLALDSFGWDGGSVGEFNAAILYDDGSVIPITEVRHKVEFNTTVRVLTKVDFLLKGADGKERQAVVKPISPAIHFSGAGYERQGKDKGPFSIEGEQWDVSQPVEFGSPRFGATGMSEYVVELQLDGEPGVGILEVSYCTDKEHQYKPTW